MGHEYRRAPGQLAKFASMKIICQHSCFSFIAPSLAATGFGAIILRSSLTGLRMTAGRPTPEREMQMRPIPLIYIGATIGGKEDFVVTWCYRKRDRTRITGLTGSLKVER
jgi:hypothetical protein